jgi:hypothetical protein
MIGDDQPRKQRDRHDKEAAEQGGAECFHHQARRAQTRMTIN